MASHFVLGKDGARIDALAKALGDELAPSTRDALGRYVELVARWNQKLDLTAAKTPSAQVEILLADALVLARGEIVPAAARCIDIGSGAGAPALPVALLRADLDMTLLEPLRKRVAFLRTALGTLGMVTRARVLEAKLDPETPSVENAPFDVALSRATFAPELWVQVGAKLASRTLVLLATAEPPAAPEGTRLQNVVEYRLPSNGAARSIAVYVREPSREPSP